MSSLPVFPFHHAICDFAVFRSEYPIMQKILAPVVLATMLAGCILNEDQDKSSTDIVALKDLIALQFPYTNARWEVVATPEYKGGVPGPTDYMTLLAEIGPRDVQRFSALPMAEPLRPLPNSARTWMNAESRTLLDTTSTGLRHQPECRTITGILTRSKRMVNGHLCTSQDRMLLYMVVVDYTVVTP